MFVRLKGMLKLFKICWDNGLWFYTFLKLISIKVIETVSQKCLVPQTFIDFSPHNALTLIKIKSEKGLSSNFHSF